MKYYKTVAVQVKEHKCLCKVKCDCCGKETVRIFHTSCTWDGDQNGCDGSGSLTAHWSCGPESETRDDVDLCYDCAEWLMDKIKDRTIRRTPK